MLSQDNVELFFKSVRKAGKGNELTMTAPCWAFGTLTLKFECCKPETYFVHVLDHIKDIIFEEPSSQYLPISLGHMLMS